VAEAGVAGATPIRVENFHPVFNPLPFFRIVRMSAKKDEGVIRAAKDITAGSVGGIAQVLTGQPFDIVKVLTFLANSASRLSLNHGPSDFLGSATNPTILGAKRVCGRHRLRQKDPCCRRSPWLLQGHRDAVGWCRSVCEHPVWHVRVYETILPKSE